jgi:PAS domain S-box-containing protein
LPFLEPALAGRDMPDPSAGPEMAGLHIDLLDSAQAPLAAGALAHALPALCFAAEPAAGRLWLSRHWLQFTGQPDLAALVAQWPHLLPPGEFEAALRAAAVPGTAAPERQARVRLRDATGEWRCHRLRVRRMDGNGGAPELWLGQLEDIEAQVRAEHALARREREFRTLVDHAPDGIARLDRWLRLVYVNEALRHNFATGPGDLLQRPLDDAGLPAAVVQAWRPAALLALTRREEQECEFSLPAADGDSAHYLCRLIPESDDGGVVDSVLCIAYDITHRRRALIALHDSEQRFRQFAQSSDDVFWFADADHPQLLYVSPAFERLWGHSTQALKADPSLWADALLAEDRALLPQPFYGSRVDASGHEPVREYRLRRADGSLVWIRDRRFPLQTDNGRVLRIGGIAEDITERKLRDLEREELLARERAARGEAEALASAKDEFLAVVSHELRSPLNAIRGWAHVMRKTTNLPPDQLRPLDAIDRNVAAQARMVDDLLDTQRLLRGRVKLEIQRTALAPLVDRAVAQFRTQAQAKQVTLDVQHAADVPEVDADAERLCQALTNLLSNAIKFTPAGGAVQVRSVRVAHDRVAIQVSDTGVGLEPAQASRVFEPFRQETGSYSTRRQGGLGLGLALARQLVELHGGRLSAASDGPDHGSTFTIELPAPLPEEAANAPSVVAALPAPPLSGRRVLVLDDDPEGRQILELLLRDEQVQGAFFASAQDAYAHLSQLPAHERPDVLISDIAMPGEDGYSFIQRVRQLHRERGEPALPAVALTAFASPTDRRRALAAGFDAHLGKPLDHELLRFTLKELLRAAPGNAV